MTTAKTRYGVAGWPVEHSRSPELHNFWLEETGIAEHYGKFAVAPGTFAEFLRETASGALLGLNITVPHKEEAARLCATRSQTCLLYTSPQHTQQRTHSINIHLP
ncbi:MAG: hypothetical protein MPK62_09885 [Alphaproteobacteria bacterium]|nr:hypothetical protein [Alphaproteobacteria bacterium]